ncbi:MAG: HPr family phosphocarrier protein [Oscillospiraceae bacterium]|nr:HPr family phosphocarrier protein [Oscillospiraceae bacterium]
MIEFNISINSVHAVKQFVETANRYDFDIDLSSGRYSIDGKSIMGIFSLDLEKPIKLTAHVDECDDFVATMKPFIVD